jgi:hypothetical protein
VPASASVTFGADLTTGDSGQGTPCDNYTYASGATGPGCVSTLVPIGPDSHAAAPVRGVITSFSIRMATPVTGHLRVGRLQDNSQPFISPFTFVATGPDVAVPGDSVAHSFPVRLTVQTGDVIGFGSSVAIYRTQQANNSRRVDRDSPDGTTPAQATLPASEVSSYETPISATIEGDADGDGYGDETQDGCPTLASTHDACPGTTPSPSGDGSGTPRPATVAPDTFAPVLSPVTLKRGTLSFLTSEPGTVRLTVYSLRAGKRSGRRCIAPARPRAAGKPCTKQTRVAVIDKPVVAQRNAIAFPRRLRVGSSTRTLSPGRYRVDVQVRDAAGNASNLVGVPFTIVKR